MRSTIDCKGEFVLTFYTRVRGENQYSKQDDDVYNGCCIGRCQRFVWLSHIDGLWGVMMGDMARGEGGSRCDGFLSLYVPSYNKWRLYN
jgi:hypothetical protein